MGLDMCQAVAAWQLQPGMLQDPAWQLVLVLGLEARCGLLPLTWPLAQPVRLECERSVRLECERSVRLECERSEA